VPGDDIAAVVPPRLFVYGTLQPGRLRWPLLAPYVTASRPAAVPGSLHDTGNGWPVAVFDAEGGDVPGVLVDLNPDPGRLDEVLALLDEIEGTVAGLLRRIVVATTDGVTTWAYHWPSSTDGMRPIRRWDSVDER
jgi:gamma-glutamylcyclotransferase (GGCT)/AIG2-like uncharacterized protein YtfP